MATVSEFFSNKLRYDLRDFGGQDFGNTQLLMFLNRAVRILDNELFQIGSDRARTSEDVTLLSAAYSMTQPTGCNTVHTIYIGQTEKRELEWITLHRRRTVWGDQSTGEPYYWSQHGTLIEWDLTADQNYTCTVVFDKWTGDLAMTSDMPYSDAYNNYLVQATTIQAEGSKKGNVSQTDPQLHQMFRKILQQENVTKRYRKRYYHMDF